MAEYTGDGAIIDNARKLMADRELVRSEAIRIALGNAGHEPNRSNQRRIEIKMARQDKATAMVADKDDEFPPMVFADGKLTPLLKDKRPSWYDELLWGTGEFDPEAAGFGEAVDIGDDFDFPRFTIRKREADRVYLVQYDDRFGSLTDILIFEMTDLMAFEASFVSPIAQMTLAETKLRRIMDKGRIRPPAA